MDQPSNAPAAPSHKTYVFVDEYNRHKRLKVMRACDGCRKRKIRCDGALQNGPWPCGACVRLKLKCVPPTLDQDDDQQSGDEAPPSSHFTFHTLSPTTSNTSNGVVSHPTSPYDWSARPPLVAPVSASGPTSAPIRRDGGVSVYSSPLFSQQPGARLDPGYSDDEYFASPTAPVQYQSNRSGPPSLARSMTQASNGSSGDPQEVEAVVKELSGQMGGLAIDSTAVAPYIADEKKMLAEMPPLEEVEVLLPSSVSTDSTVRIPREMMPDEDQAMNWFQYYFNFIHPYVPVLTRHHFYHQWQHERDSISPLLLEAIFACVARYHGDPIEVRRWLALAARHEESFKDVPRLSTIQALIILMKAREAVPRQGYYFRSWMNVKYMTTMAIDLGFHEHYAQHRDGDGCGRNPTDCLLWTRIWQTLFLLEVLVGAPQGRTDFAVKIDAVDFALPRLTAEINDFEYHTSRRATYFAQAVRNIKEANIMWQGMRWKTKEWALSPTFVGHNDAIDRWLTGLPSDMQIHYPEDDSLPRLDTNHHLAYLHQYHNLVIIMHHRPQLQMMLEKGNVDFKKHLDICNEAAIRICRLQEALYEAFRLHGLTFMVRGIGFTVYSILTCAMLHLVSITSPDPITNARARNYFTRHMQLLEQCTSSAAPELQMQINNLREAFSEDTSKPFAIKSTLGARSPSAGNTPTPPMIAQVPHGLPGSAGHQWAHYPETTISQPLSATSQYSQPYDRMASQPPVSLASNSYPMLAQADYSSNSLHRVTSAPQQSYALTPVVSNEQTTPVWDPSGIFNQWHTAFGGQAQQSPSQPTRQSPVDYRSLPTSVPMIPQQQPTSGQYPLYSAPQLQVPQPRTTAALPDQVPSMPTVTPNMWHDAFTNAYVSGYGNKRNREESVDMSAYNPYQRRRQ